MSINIEKQSVSLAGEFFVLAELSLRNLVATLTLGNTKSVDILVSNPQTKKLFKIEVKTTTSSAVNSRIFGRNYEWFMDKKHENIADKSLFYCFVLLEDVNKLPRFFIVPNKDVARYVKEENIKYHKAPRKKKVKKTDMRMFRIGADEKSKYENNWAVLEN